MEKTQFPTDVWIDTSHKTLAPWYPFGKSICPNPQLEWILER